MINAEAADFLHSHSPEACCLDTHQLEDVSFWIKVADADRLAVLMALGVRLDITVVVYGCSATTTTR